jgi:peptidoglycan hydrolase CwlO-like protein
MELLYVILGLLIVWTGLSIYIIKNLLKKLEKFEDFVETMNEEINSIDKSLSAIDERVSFRSDDEIGFYFDEIKKLQNHVNQFKLK